MSQAVSFARKHGFDVLIVVAATEAVLEVAFRADVLRTPRSPLWFAIPAVALVVLPLLARHRFPFGAPATLWVLAAAVSFVDGRLIVFPAGVYVAGIAAAYLLGSVRDAAQARIGLPIVVIATAILVYNDPNRTPSEFIAVPALFAVAWLAGFTLRARSAQADAAEQRAIYAERERESAARIAVAEERARIARELHDIVAHSVSVMVLQVGAVRLKLPEAMVEDKEALRGVEQTGRAALQEMRRLLGAMHDDGQAAELAPQPSLDSLGALAERVGRAGLPVHVRVEGDAFPLPRAIDLSAYRIVQEALTNALKHARATHADVTVRYRPDMVEVEVVDDGTGAATSNGLGHGLVGIRERVKIYGGDMNAGTAPGGGFVVRARLPLDRGES
jgi:signal transduction histidine kinase